MHNPTIEVKGIIAMAYIIGTAISGGNPEVGKRFALWLHNLIKREKDNA